VVRNSALKRRKNAAAAFAVHRHSRWRVAVTFLALLTFTLQNYIVQTHLHGLPQTMVASIGHQIISSSRQDQTPQDNDALNCPLCQEALHGGSFVLPAAIAALPPALAVSIVATIVAPLRAAKSASHSWLGRAPPHA
jgi:hypothetical protein